jgi:hypothetical protein
MAEYDAFSERKKAHEEDYFRKKDRELIEKMKETAAADRAKRDLGAKTGIVEPAVLQELHELGFTPETVVLLPLVPVVQMAWAEGGVTPAERKLLGELARARGVAEGSAADHQLSEWMTTRPGTDVFAKASRLIRAMLDAGSQEGDRLSADDVIRQAESIASASGGMFGIGKVSAEERAMLARLATELKSRT